MYETYFLIYHICNIIFYVLFGLSGLLLLFKAVLHLIAFLPAKKFPPAKKNHKYAIVIPARNESKVISGILDSIKAQTYPAELIDTYIIVESADDQTCVIAKHYPNTHIFVREHLELKGKGHAMDELFQKLLKDKNIDYEAYFIFDADNILYPDYIEQMNRTFDQGYEVATGYRNNKNWNDNWISACSGLTFTIFNTFDNKPKSKLGLNVNICGTGFYVSAKLIKKIGGYKFFTLTEDQEFKCYSVLNNIKSTYNANAGFYDEQPVKMKVSWVQRTRWCKGYSQVNKIYTKKLLKSGLKEKGKDRANQLITALGVIPLIVTVASIAIFQFLNLVLMVVALCINYSRWAMPLIGFAASALALYLFLALYTLILLIIERKNIKLRFWRFIICVLTNPIFILLYIPIYVGSLFKKDVVWVPIERKDPNNNIAKNDKK